MSKNKFDYMLPPVVRAELVKCGIQFTQLDSGDGLWPAFKLPSGHVLGIAADDEGNGPGAIHTLAPGALEK